MQSPRIRLSCVLALATFAFTAPIVGAQSTPVGGRLFTADDLFSLEQIGDVVPSPDGAWVAYVHKRQPRTASGYKRDFMQGADYADIWIAPAAGGAPRNITNGAADGSGYFAPVWSPDGKRLALLSTKGGNVYLWTWEPSSGRLRQVITDRASAAITAANIAWTDNTHLVTAVLPPGDSPLSLVVERLPALTLTQAWPKAWKGQETTASVLDAGLGEQPVRAKRELRLVDVERGTASAITTGDVGAFAVSPDRRRIVVARRTATYQPTADGRVAVGLNRDRHVLDILAADGREIWKPVEGLGSPRAGLGPPQLLWSDDGTQLAVFARAATGASLDDRLYRIDVDAKAVRDVTPADLDLTGATLSWASNAKLLLLAKRRDPDPKKARNDWWLVGSATDVRNLTAAAPSAPARLVRTTDDNALIGVASSAIWRVTLDGSAPTNLALQPASKFNGVVWPSDPTAKATAVVVTAAGDKGDEFYRVELPSARVTPLATPAGDARLAAGLRDNSGFYFIADDGAAGTSLALVRAAGGSPSTLASLNGFLRSVSAGETRKFEYRTTDGQDVKGWLLLPPGYQAGRKYPMVLWVYAGSVMVDKPPASMRLNQFSAFNMQIAAAHGYVVMFPSMPLKPNPEDANWAGSDPYFDLPKGVLPAIDKVIDMGIADPKKVGVMGQSYGGYSTMALITQTERFAAAVELAGPPDLLSLYGQFETREGLSDDRMENSGRDVYYLDWSESGQGRMGNPPWKDLQRYLRNSPIVYADKIKTPLMLVQGDMDIIGLQQGQEMFTALYRQNKRARFVRYWGEGHVLNSPANIKDFWSRAFDWFDQYFAGTGTAP